MVLTAGVLAAGIAQVDVEGVGVRNARVISDGVIGEAEEQTL